jgi:hypothetical protein
MLRRKQALAVSLTRDRLQQRMQGRVVRAKYIAPFLAIHMCVGGGGGIEGIYPINHQSVPPPLPPAPSVCTRYSTVIILECFVVRKAVSVVAKAVKKKSFHQESQRSARVAADRHTTLGLAACLHVGLPCMRLLYARELFNSSPTSCRPSAAL